MLHYTVKVLCSIKMYDGNVVDKVNFKIIQNPCSFCHLCPHVKKKS